MKNIPLWQDVNTKKYPKLNNDISTDVLIIGGGITGVSTFYHLKNDKRDVVLVEKNRIGFGITSRSTAKITFLQENIYSKLFHIFDEATAKLYYESQKEAIDDIVKTIKMEGIMCDIEKSSSYLYTMKESETDKISEEKNLLERWGESLRECDNLPNCFKIKNGFSVSGTYTFHPVKFVTGLAAKGTNNKHRIYENTSVVDIRKHQDIFYCYTKDAVIKCKDVILAMHYPFFLFPYVFPLKCYLEKSFIIASSGNNKRFNAINISKPYLSIRYYKDKLLTCGGTTNLAFKQNYNANVDKLKQFANSNIEYIWSNHDIMTLDKLPYIGFLKDRMILATGYNTWGMTNGFLAGCIIKDLLNNKYNKFKELFDPKRGLNKNKVINYPLFLFNNGYSLSKSYIVKNKSWYHDNPKFIKIDGISVALYKDNNGKTHIVKSKCPHFKCTLLFNNVEHTWDCPCHGSRFDLDGKAIVGPSKWNIVFKDID